MISIAIILFFLPLVFRMLWAKKSFFFNIATTTYCYSAWYFVSYFLIIVGINFDAYLYIFALFPLALVLYETYRLVQNRRTVSVDAKMVYLFLFILVAIMANLFTYKVFSDASTYIRFGIESKLNNTFAPTNSIYKYNSFYYIATTLGLFNVQYFYSVFVPLFIGVFMFLALLEIVKIGFPTIWKWYYVLPIAILVAFLANTEYGVDANWYTGSIIFLILLLWFVSKLKDRDFFGHDLLVIFFIFFLSNFSLTTIVVGLPIWFLLMVLLFFFSKVELRSLFFTPLFIFAMIIAFMPIKSTEHYTLLILILYFSSILTVALLLIIFRKNAKKRVGILKISNLGIAAKEALSIKRNKIYFLCLFAAIYIILLILLLTFRIYAYFPAIINSETNPVPGDDFPPSIEWLSLLPPSLLQNATSASSVYSVVYLLLMFVSFLICIMISRYEYLVYLTLILIIYVTYTIFVLELPNLVPDYLIARVFFAFNSGYLTINLVFIFALIETNKKAIVTILFFPLLLFSGINLNTPFNPIFDSNIRLNNTQTTRKNFDFLINNYQEYFVNGDPIFSEIDTAFMTDFNLGNHEYLQSMIGKLYVARNYAGRPNRSPLNVFDKYSYSNNDDLPYFINWNLKNPGYFKVLILRDNTKLINEYNLDASYFRVKDNGEISIWSILQK